VAVAIGAVLPVTAADPLADIEPRNDDPTALSLTGGAWPPCGGPRWRWHHGPRTGSPVRAHPWAVWHEGGVRRPVAGLSGADGFPALSLLPTPELRLAGPPRPSDALHAHLPVCVARWARRHGCCRRCCRCVGHRLVGKVCLSTCGERTPEREHSRGDWRGGDRRRRGLCRYCFV
jgi:hypothetical protein